MVILLLTIGGYSINGYWLLFYKWLFDALLSSLLDPLEGLSVLNCGKLELGTAP